MTWEQQKQFDLLCYFSDICEREGLRYYLAGGTLLGAVRHKGFIPWDDDIDLMMPLKDFKVFISEKRAFPEGIKIQSEQTDSLFPFLVTRLCNSNVPLEREQEHGPEGIYIDIFPLMPSVRPGRKSVFIFNVICVIDYVLQVKCGWRQYEPYKTWLARLGYRTLDSMPKERLRKLRLRLARFLHKEGTEHCLSVCGEHKGATEFYPKRWFESEERLAFEGRYFPAPTGWDAYLKQLYGDYMTPPAADDRRPAHRF